MLKISDEAIMLGAKDTKQLARAASVNHEIRLRKNQINNVNIYYNMFAVNYIREDENPLIYNLQAQKEKVAAFKKGSKVEDSFFFALPELKSLCKELNILTGNWSDIESLSDKASQRNEQAIEILKQ